ncbi:MAG: hypothetical protein HY539_05860 [Deltaproteobacteria bacterium]|nr:hypothetical protein [Deltaproteobacteria bacterium]
MAINGITQRIGALNRDGDSNGLETARNGIVVESGTASHTYSDFRALLGSIALGSGLVAAAVLRGRPVYRTTLRVGQSSNRGTSSAMVGVWFILWNLAYGVRRARGEDDGWQTLFFIFGLPLTMISWIFVDSGSNDFFGFDVTPKSKRS